MKSGKKLAVCAAVLILAAAATLGGIKLYRIHQRDQCGILLAFDDYDAYGWEDCFELFREYDVKVTFFVTAEEPRSEEHV